MTLEQFKRFIDALNAFYAAEDRLSNVFYTIIEFCPPITESIHSYIEEYFNDKWQWFDFWFYDLDQGKEWTETSCTDENDNAIKLQTVEDIYNLLVENKNEKNCH